MGPNMLEPSKPLPKNGKQGKVFPFLPLFGGPMIQDPELNFWNFRNAKDLAGKWHEEHLDSFDGFLELVGKTIW